MKVSVAVFIAALFIAGAMFLVAIKQSASSTELSRANADLQAAISRLDSVKNEYKELKTQNESMNERLQELQDSVIQMRAHESKPVQITEASKLTDIAVPPPRHENVQLAPEPRIQNVAEVATSDTVVCPFCDGDFRSHWVTCDRKAGAGCEGHGYRPCFDCGGKGTVACSYCNGSGRIVTEVSTGPGMWKKLNTRTDPCEVCNGSGRIDCTTCIEMYARVPRNPAEVFLEPILSQGPPIGGDDTIVISGYYTILVEEHYGVWRSLIGQVICPKCTGRGRVRERGICEHCKEGRIKKVDLDLK